MHKLAQEVEEPVIGRAMGRYTVEYRRVCVGIGQDMWYSRRAGQRPHEPNIETYASAQHIAEEQIATIILQIDVLLQDGRGHRMHQKRQRKCSGHTGEICIQVPKLAEMYIALQHMPDQVDQYEQSIGPHAVYRVLDQSQQGSYLLLEQDGLDQHCDYH